MTVTPSMTTRATLTGVVLVFVAAAAVTYGLQLVKMPATGGWRSTNAAPVAQPVPTPTRGTNAMDGVAAMRADGISAARGRN